MISRPKSPFLKRGCIVIAIIAGTLAYIYYGVFPVVSLAIANPFHGQWMIAVGFALIIAWLITERWIYKNGDLPYVVRFHVLILYLIVLGLVTLWYYSGQNLQYGILSSGVEKIISYGLRIAGWPAIILLFIVSFVGVSSWLSLFVILGLIVIPYTVAPGFFIWYSGGLADVPLSVLRVIAIALAFFCGTVFITVNFLVQKRISLSSVSKIFLVIVIIWLATSLGLAALLTNYTYKQSARSAVNNCRLETLLPTYARIKGFTYIPGRVRIGQGYAPQLLQYDDSKFISYLASLNIHNAKVVYRKYVDVVTHGGSTATTGHLILEIPRDETISVACILRAENENKKNLGNVELLIPEDYCHEQSEDYDEHRRKVCQDYVCSRSDPQKNTTYQCRRNS